MPTTWSWCWGQPEYARKLAHIAAGPWVAQVPGSASGRRPSLAIRSRLRPGPRRQRSPPPRAHARLVSFVPVSGSDWPRSSPSPAAAHAPRGLELHRAFARPLCLGADVGRAVPDGSGSAARVQARSTDQPPSLGTTSLARLADALVACSAERASDGRGAPGADLTCPAAGSQGNPPTRAKQLYHPNRLLPPSLEWTK
jgi:hypothetical protein